MIDDAQPTARKALPQQSNIEQALTFGWQQIQQAESFAQAFGLPELGDIELAPAFDTAVYQAQLRAVAPLYLAAELEQAMVLPAVEMLTGVWASGGLATSAHLSELLTAFWQHRHQHFAAPERQALFQHLFGSDSNVSFASGYTNTAFNQLCIHFAEALYRSPSTLLAGGFTSSDAKLRIAAQQLTANLIQFTGGVMAFAARDLLTANQEAIRLLKQPELYHLLQAHGPWSAVANIAQRYLDKTPAIAEHVARGQAGMLILAWLARKHAQIETMTQPLTLEPTIVAAAGAWLQASLTLQQSRLAAFRQRA